MTSLDRELDRHSSPGSNAESSTLGPKTAKDKACPFCGQPFTSSSLGRHLDLYIKPKNPKPPDGIHDVLEIRKLRAGITRRQPRGSLGQKREASGTPQTTPGPQQSQQSQHHQQQHHQQPLRQQSLRPDSAPRSPVHDSRPLDRATEHAEYRSPAVVGSRFYPDETPSDGVRMQLGQPTWEATGVMKHIPPLPRGQDSNRVDVAEQLLLRHPPITNGSAGASKHNLAKAVFDQKQKVREAMDSARAAELALREIVGSLQAATKIASTKLSVFDYDPLSFDFPALCLHCLPPPPTLRASTPIPSSRSWSIEPPTQQQLEALHAHFSSCFQSWRLFHAISSNRPPEDDLSYPPPINYERFSETEIDTEMHKRVAELETQISEHLSAIFSQWQSRTPSDRAELWHLELARSVGMKATALQAFEVEYRRVLQDNEHWRLQVEQLSRCQQPREFQQMPPGMVPLSAEMLKTLGGMATGRIGSTAAARPAGVGLQIADKDESVGDAVGKAIDRWRKVVQLGRGKDAQKSFENSPGGHDSPSIGLLARPGSSAMDRSAGMFGSAHDPLSVGVTPGPGEQDVDMDAEFENDDAATVGADAGIPSERLHPQRQPQRSQSRNRQNQVPQEEQQQRHQQRGRSHPQNQQDQQSQQRMASGYKPMPALDHREYEDHIASMSSMLRSHDNVRT